MPAPMEQEETGVVPRWGDLRSAALIAEDVGFDTVWVPDELLWTVEAWDGPRGWWECIALTGAVAEATSTIAVGTWVLSALHRNPALTVRAVETLDEISGGRLVFGFGSGHAGRQGENFGFPLDVTVGRYEEALEIVVPLLRDGSVDYDGSYHRAADLVSRPRGPRPGKIPLLLGGHGPRTMRLAVQHADIWSGYATTSPQPEAFTEMLALLDRVCERQGRDPSTLGRSIGILAEPPESGSGRVARPDVFVGSVDDYLRLVEAYADAGVTRLELMVDGGLDNDIAASVERFAPVLERAADV